MVMTRLKLIDQFCADHPEFTQGAVRHLIFKHAPRDQNNPHSDHALQKAVIRTGRRVRINDELFMEGLAEISKNRQAT